MAGAELASLATSPEIIRYSPGRASFLGLIPGLGAVYNRQYRKGLIHFSVFAGLVFLSDPGPRFFALAAFAFYLFSIIDAHRSAKMLLRRQVTQLQKSEVEPMDTLVWGTILVLIGVLFLLDNLGIFSFRAMAEDFWPLILVALGLYLILDHFFGPSQASRSSVGGPSQNSPVIGDDLTIDQRHYDSNNANSKVCHKCEKGEGV